MNFMGLGFSFGAKDIGLRQTQSDIASGFAKINLEISGMNTNAAQMSLPGMGADLPQEEVGKFDEAMKNLANTVGVDLPEAGRRGSSAFGRRGEEITGTEKKIAEGFGLIEKSVDKLDGILRQNKLQTFIQSIALSKLNKIGQGIGGLANSTTNLTTSLEAQGVAAAKAARSIGVNYGFSGKELGKFSSKVAGMTIGLNISAQTAGAAMRAWKEGSKELRAMGFTSAKGVAKFSEALGVNADVLRNAGKQMTALGLKAKDITLVTSAVSGFGKHSGDVAGALNALPSIMDQVAKRASQIAMGYKGMKPAEFAAQTMSLARAFFNVTQDGAKARDAAMGLAQSMLDARGKLGQLAVGAEQDLPDMYKQMAIVTGNMGKSFKMMEQGPAGLLQGFGKMVLAVKKTGKDTAPLLAWIGGRLEGTFGADKTQLITNMLAKVDDKTIQSLSNTKKATINLQKLGKAGFSTGRTLADSFDLVEQSFIAKFRSISRVEARSFVRDTGKEFNKFAKHIKEAAKDDGPMGLVIKKFSEMHQLGAMSLLPKTLRPMAAVLGSISKNALPVVTAFGSLGLRIGMLLNPVTLLVAGLAALVMITRGVTSSAQKSITAISRRGKAFRAEKKLLGGLIKQQEKAKVGSEKWHELTLKINRSQKKLDFARRIRLATAAKDEKKVAGIRAEIAADAKKRTIDDIKNFAKKITKKVVTFVKALPEIVKGVWSEVEGFATLIFGWIGDGFDFLAKVNWTKMWDKVFKGIGGFYNALFGEKRADSTKKGFGTMIGIALKKGVIAAWSFLKSGLSLLWKKFTNWWNDPMKSFGKKMKEAGKLIMIGLATAMVLSGAARGLILQGFSSLFTMLRGRALFGTALVVAAVYRAWKVWPAYYKRIAKAWTDEHMAAGDKVMTTSQEVFGSILAIVGVSSKTANSIWESATNRMSDSFMSFAGILKVAWNAIKLGWEAITLGFKLAWSWAVNDLLISWENFKLQWRFGINSIKIWWNDLTTSMSQKWTDITNTIMEKALALGKYFAPDVTKAYTRQYENLQKMWSQGVPAQKAAIVEAQKQLQAEINKGTRTGYAMWEVGLRAQKVFATTSNKLEADKYRAQMNQGVANQKKRVDLAKETAKREAGQLKLATAKAADAHILGMKKGWAQTKKYAKLAVGSTPITAAERAAQAKIKRKRKRQIRLPGKPVAATIGAPAVVKASTANTSAVIGMTKAADGLAAKIGTITGETPKLDAKERKKIKPSGAKKALERGPTSLADIVSAVNMPSWYAQYETLFVSSMKALTASVSGGRAGGGTRPPGGRSRGVGGGGVPPTAGNNPRLGR